MKVTFKQDHQSTASGNEFYKAGSQADLVKGQTLVESGVAYAGWGKLPPDDVEAIEQDVEELHDANGKHISDYTKAELIKAAREAGIPYAGLTKVQLVEILTEAE